ncbi:MAG: M28 family peptidase [Oscillospiraceae bacterium]
MIINATREFELLKKLGFERQAGTDMELKAAHMIEDEIKSAGSTAIIEPFEITDAVIEKAELEVLEPYNKKYTVTAYKRCLNTDDNGLIADFVYIEDMLDVSLADVKDKIVLVNGYMRLAAYRKLIKAGVAGFISMTGSLLDTQEDSDLFTRKIRETMDDIGFIPAVNIRISDAFELVAQKASKVKMTVKNEKVNRTSHNVIAEIKGTKYPDEIISFGAHYDSVEFSTGVYDNGAGSVINLEIFRHFLANPPKRTLKFMWYGSEEIGLLGSKAYVEMHEKELEKHILMINVDVAGPVIGSESLVMIADNSFVNFADAYMRIKGHPVKVRQDTYSSDCIPFANCGIPAINFMRFGPQGAAFIHCRNDVIEYLSQDALERTTIYTLDFCENIINSVAFPLERKIPKEMVEAVDKYLSKSLIEEIKKENEKIN